MALQVFTANQTLTASQLNALQSSDFNYTRNLQTGVSYTFQLSDRGKLVEFQNAGTVTVTMPQYSTVAFDIGDVIELLNTSTGVVDFVGAAGVTISAADSITSLQGQWHRATLINRAQNSWVLVGNTAQYVPENSITNSKLITISTAGKVSNSATTATATAGNSTIVARDGSGNFAAGTITANLTGVATYTAEWILGADGSNHYTFTGPGLTGAENDPTIHLVRGQKYKFTNTMGAHPFRIQSTVNGSTGTAYSDGVTNNDVSNGTLIWDVQFDTPSVLYYQCTAHGSMGGKIYIVDETASMIGTRTVFVQQATPTANATGDIWFQVTGIAPLT